MKLFYKINSSDYDEILGKLQDRFKLHKEVDEARTFLLPNSDDEIEQITGTFDPAEDDIAQIRVVLVDESLKDIFDSILGEPYRVR
jgi:hypothetical protein